MERVNHYLDNQLIKPPYNWQELSLNLNWDKDNQTQAVTVTDWTFVRENAEIITNHLQAGLIGGRGVFEGIPYRIEVVENDSVEVIFNGYLDLTQGAIFSCERSTIKAVERSKLDWLNDVSDGFTFEYLFSIGAISKEDFIFQPYVINTVPNYRDAAIAYVTSFVVTQEILNAIQKIAELIPQLANPFEGSAIVRAVLYITYLSFLLIALIKIIQQVFQLIIQPVKYHAGMKSKTMLQKGAEHLGLTFKSPFFDGGPYENEVIIPEKFFNPADDEGILGFKTPNKNAQIGYFKGTFGDLLRAYKTKFRAKIIITDNKELLLVPDNYTEGSPLFTMPPINNDFFELNAADLKSTYFLRFQTDLSEKNTIADYAGTSYQVITRPNSFTSDDLVLMKGMEEVVIPFALAKRKVDLTLPEKILSAFIKTAAVLLSGLIIVINTLIKAVNLLIRVLNKVIKALGVIGIKINFQIKPIPTIAMPQFGNLITNRIGMLMLENDFFNVPKCYILDEGSEPKKNKVALIDKTSNTAKFLYENYHITQSFVPNAVRPCGNQYIIKDFEKVPFCLTNFVQVKENNFIFNSDGREAEILELDWNPYEQTAKIKLRINELYTNNLREVTHEPTGN